MFLLWIDDDLDEFPAIKRIARKKGLDVAECYSLADAAAWIEDRGHPKIVLLDAIVPTGVTPDGKLEDLESDPDNVGSDLEVRYTGLLFLRQFPELSDKTLIFSIVPQERLATVGFPSEARVFSKVDLGKRLDDFRKEISRILNGGSGDREEEIK